MIGGTVWKIAKGTDRFALVRSAFSCLVVKLYFSCFFFFVFISAFFFSLCVCE